MIEPVTHHPLDLIGFLTLGLLGGFGHCIGMCAPFVLFVSRQYAGAGAGAEFPGGARPGPGMAAAGAVPGSAVLPGPTVPGHGGPAPAASYRAPGAGRRAAFGAQLWYTAGRVVTYAALGALAGALGGAIERAGALVGLQRAAAIVAGAVLILWALARLLDWAWVAHREEAGSSPLASTPGSDAAPVLPAGPPGSASAFPASKADSAWHGSSTPGSGAAPVLPTGSSQSAPALPASEADSAWHRASALCAETAGRLFARVARTVTGRVPGHPFTVGLFLGLLPCGFLYSALVAAIARGGPLQGATALVLFGIGTAPALLGVSLADELLARRRVILDRLAQLFILVMGIWFLLRGF